MEYLFEDIGEIKSIPYRYEPIDLAIQFEIETFDNMLKEDIMDRLLSESLEDGCYEGFDNGWAIPILDRKNVYGNIDYRYLELIKIEEIVNVVETKEVFEMVN